MNRRSNHTGEQHWRKVLKVQHVKTVTRTKCVCNKSSLTTQEPGPSLKDTKSVGIFTRLSVRIRTLLHSRRKYEISDGRDKADNPLSKIKPFNFYHGSKLTIRRSDINDKGFCKEKPRLKRQIDEQVKIEISANDDHGIKYQDRMDNLSQSVTTTKVSTLSNLALPTESDKTSIQTNTKKQSPVLNERLETVIKEKESISLDLGMHVKEEKKLSPLRVPVTNGLSPKHPLTMTTSCPPKATTISSSADGSDQGFKRLLKTWPIPGRKISEDDPEDEEQTECQTFIDRLILQGRTSIDDFSIPFKNVELLECLKEGRRCKIYRGKWHGDVTVHLFNERDDDSDTFWMNLTELCRIRHENIILFMAACTEPPNLAVITSYHRGTSLYERIHIKHEKIGLYSKIQILRQIALGMGYLHARSIVLRRLNSHNVFLCPRVKLSVVDWGIAETIHDRSNYAVIPHHQLTYVAPEILASACVKPPRLVTMATTYSKDTDIFAFGTVMYEVFAGRYPLDDLDPMTFIWWICGGRRQLLDGLRCTTPLKKLINGCWCQEPFNRPEFSLLSKELLKNFPLHKRHSSSEPERLHTKGRIS